MSSCTIDDAVRIWGNLDSKALISETTSDFKNLLAREVYLRTPVRTGRMLAGWEVQDDNAGVITVKNYVPYSGFVEFGTSRQAPQHIVERAYLASKDWYEQAFQTKISSYLDEDSHYHE